MVNDNATSFLQRLLNHAWLDPARGIDPGKVANMKYDGKLEGQEWHPRDTRIDAKHDVRVHCEAGDFEAEVVNLSSDGFRLRSHDPLEVGWEVTLESLDHNPVKAVICWACGLDAGGVFAEPVAL
ncbi:MAG: PilZ domain-containing protein [Pseudomonadota bacterium]